MLRKELAEDKSQNFGSINFPINSHHQYPLMLSASLKCQNNRLKLNITHILNFIIKYFVFFSLSATRAFCWSRADALVQWVHHQMLLVRVILRWQRYSKPVFYKPWTGKLDMLQFAVLQTAGHDLMTEQQLKPWSPTEQLKARRCQYSTALPLLKFCTGFHSLFL